MDGTKPTYGFARFAAFIKCWLKEHRIELPTHDYGAHETYHLNEVDLRVNETNERRDSSFLDFVRC